MAECVMRESWIKAKLWRKKLKCNVIKGLIESKNRCHQCILEANRSFGEKSLNLMWEWGNWKQKQVSPMYFFVFVSSAPPGHLRVSSVRGLLALLTPTGDFVALRCSSRPGGPLPSSPLGTLPERPPQTQALVKPVFCCQLTYNQFLIIFDHFSIQSFALIHESQSG